MQRRRVQSKVWNPYLSLIYSKRRRNIITNSVAVGMVSVPSLARFRTERHMTEMELNTRIAELEEEQIKPAPPSRSWEYRRGQSTKRLIRLYKIVTSSYVPHAGYVDWSFEGEHPVPSGKYIKYPNNSNCQRWIKRQTSKRVRHYKCIPVKGIHSADSSIIGGLCTKITLDRGRVKLLSVLLDTPFVILVMLADRDMI